MGKYLFKVNRQRQYNNQYFDVAIFNVDFEHVFTQLAEAATGDVL